MLPIQPQLDHFGVLPDEVGMSSLPQTRGELIAFAAEFGLDITDILRDEAAPAVARAIGRRFWEAKTQEAPRLTLEAA